MTYRKTFRKKTRRNKRRKMIRGGVGTPRQSVKQLTKKVNSASRARTDRQRTDRQRGFNARRAIPSAEQLDDIEAKITPVLERVANVLLFYRNQDIAGFTPEQLRQADSRFRVLNTVELDLRRLLPTRNIAVRVVNQQRTLTEIIQVAKLNEIFQGLVDIQNIFIDPPYDDMVNDRGEYLLEIAQRMEGTVAALIRDADEYASSSDL